MATIEEYFPLTGLNTFHIAAQARYFARFDSLEVLEELLQFRPARRHLILGGGSNLLFTRHYNGLVLKNEIRGIDIVKEDDRHVYLRAGAGENWHQFVCYCIERGFAGVENLSLIPGMVGASPMQNIGAYGVEIKDVFYDLEAFHLHEKKLVTLTHSDCAFGYRDSVFKHRYRGMFAITHVTFRLNKYPSFHTEYGAIRQELERMNAAPGIRTISEAVIRIRSSKLPDPAVIGNAGSFFKNPTVSATRFQALRIQYPDLPGYPQDEGQVKLAAGWLIEQCGWKGYRSGDAGCHAQQALVLVNHGQATGKEIYRLSEKIRRSVLKKFDVALETEVNII